MTARPEPALRSADSPRWSFRLWASVLLCALCAALGALPAPLAAQQETFEGATEVIEVQVPVNVVDRNGEPVRGLTAEDFAVFDQGDRQELTGFEVIDLDVLEPATATKSAVDDLVPAPARRHFFLLFDLTFATPASVIKARRAAREFVLEELHPTDLAAVATFSMDVGPRLIVTFTPDRAQLARAIDTLGAPRLLQQEAAVDPLRFMIESPSRAAMSSTFNEGTGPTDTLASGVREAVQAYLNVIGDEIERAEKSYRRGRVASWMSALGDMAKMLGSVEGRKHVVLFSEGFDGRLMLGRGPDPYDEEAQEDQLALQTGQHWMVDSDDIYGNTALQNHVTRMMEEFRRADCLIQAVDISGLGTDSAEDRRASSTGQDALFYMANETGGTLFENANDLGHELDEVLERSSVTYLLSFSPDDLKPDGTYHRLKVRLTKDLPRGTDVSHRSGYYAPRPFKELHPLEKSLITSDAIASAAPRDSLDLNVLVAPFRANEERAYVPVIIEVDGEKLLAGLEEDKLSAEIYAYVSDHEGQMKDFFTQVVSLDVSGDARDALRRTGLKYYGHMDLDAGRYLVRVLVRNPDTGRTGVRSVRLDVPDYAASHPQLLPPFFLEPMGSWVLVREQTSSDRETVVYPFTVNGSPYVPAAKPELEPGEEMDVCLVAYNLADGEVELEGTVVTEDGREIDAGRLSLVERTLTGISHLDKVLARFAVDGLEGGSYTLRVALKQPESGITRTNSIPFSIPN